MTNSFLLTRNPDVLSCLANLSNDEVFTPPEVVSQMLDMLPEEIWHDRNATFLDPACKTGVFLREIAKRLIEAQLPNYEQISCEINEKLRAGDELDGRDIAFQNTLESVIEHVFKNQVFGIAITELTSLLSRRSVYCSKYPQSEYSVVRFDNPEGRIDYKQMQHTWKNGKCIYCGASEGEYNREEGKERYAYEFIHLDNPEEVFDMKFDVVIGNPPYQMGTSGKENGSQAKPIYQKFVQQAKKLNPRYIVMITQARWYTGGWGLDSFREEMFSEKKLRILHDFPNANDCFPGVPIKGGVSFFLWDRDNPGDCEIVTHHGDYVGDPMIRPLIEDGLETFIRYNDAVSILRKVVANEGAHQAWMDSIVSPQKPFGLGTSFRGENIASEKSIRLFQRGGTAYVRRDALTTGFDSVDKYKIFISAAYGAGEDYPHQILNKPIFGDIGTACTETYVMIGPFSSETETRNAISYIQTKLFRFLVLLNKPTQHALRKVYKLVPLQDFSKAWTDEELYKKYGITEKEQAFIDSMIRPMELGD